jgi:hypothetical protein
MSVVSRRGDRQHLADRLDPVLVAVRIDEADHGFPPLALVKLERRATHLEMSRDTYVAAILKRATEDGRPTIVETRADDLPPNALALAMLPI